jgi:hypothetical protein
MKKVLFVTIILLQLYQSKAQSVSVNYVKQFVSDNKSTISGKNFAPYTASGFTVAYSQVLKKAPITLNAVATRVRRKPPPWLIPYPDPPVFGKYAKDNNIEADSVGSSNSQANSIEFLAGVGYILPHKEKSKLIVTLNADLGVAFNNNTTLYFFFRGRKTASLEQKKTQFVFNPSVQAKYFLTDNIGLNITAGYNNRGGVNGGLGIVIGKKSSYVGHVTLLR